MFKGKLAVLYLVKNQAAVFINGDSTDAYEIDWDGVKLDEVFSQIKDELKVGRVIVLLGAEVSYCLSLDKSENMDRESLRKLAAAQIPDDLDDHNFDWKVIGDRVQVAAVSPFLLQALSHAAQKTSIKLEAILPAAIVLSQIAAAAEKPKLLVWEGFENLGVICHNGVVFFSSGLEEISPAKVSDLIDYSRDKYSLEIDQVESNAKAVSLPDSVSWKEAELEVYRYLVDHPVESGSDSKVLTLTPVEVTKPDEAPAKLEGPSTTQIKETVSAAPPPPEPERGSKLGLIIGGILLLLLVIFGVGLFRLYSPGQDEAVVEVVPTVTEAITPTPTPEPVLSDYPVRILNGSGTPGEASRVADILEEAGFVVEETGNADSYDYDETEISYLEDVPESILEQLRGQLAEFVLAEGKVLQEADGYSILIVVGSQSQDDVR
jgi:hypothetical protein